MQNETYEQVEEDIALFEDDAKRILSQIRITLAELITILPGEIASGADLSRTLNLDRNLSWNIYKAATTPNPIDAGPHIPEPPSMKRFLRSASKHSGLKEFIARLEILSQEFQTLVKYHAGDRATFNSMANAFTINTISDSADLVHKRSAYRANKHIQGIHAKSVYRCCIIQPSDKDPEWLDIASIKGVVDLQTIYPDTPFAVSRIWTENDAGEVCEQRTREPLSNHNRTPHDPPLIPEFCSRPLPNFINTVSANTIETTIETTIESHRVGRSGAITSIEGIVAKQVVPRYRQESEHFGDFSASVQIPCESLIFDILIRSDTFPGSIPEVIVYGDNLSGSPRSIPVQNRTPLRITEKVEYFGEGPSALHTPTYPDSVEIAHYVFNRLGWNGEEFDVWRCVIEYPVMPSETVLRFQLPNRPTP